MGLYTGTVKNLHRAPYREQVLTHLITMGADMNLSADEERKVERVKRFLHASDCAREILESRGKKHG